MTALNLGIVAHVDAGKTSLTERLLHTAGVIEEVGSVDAGSTRTDTLDLERQRGITIKSAVVSLVVAGGVTVNLIDTPGHPDFIAEVERVLSVLDGAVLVVSAVEGVQAQTRVLMRTLQRLRIPTLIFVNKIDRTGAGYGDVLQSLSARLAPGVVAMGSVEHLGTRRAAYAPFTGADAPFRARLTEVLAEHDDALLAAYVEGDAGLPYDRLRRALTVQVRQARVHPVFFGSAITGAGVDALVDGIAALLPAGAGDPGGPLAARVFKVERGPAGERIAYVRVFEGTLRARDKVTFGHRRETKVTAIDVFEGGTTTRRDEVTAGRIAKVRGLGEVRIGESAGTAAVADEHFFAPPTLETVVVPRHPRDRGRLQVALTQLAEQDPLIGLSLDDAGQELSVSLYGEVQKEVIQATLAADFGVDVTFRETTTVCIERPLGVGSALERNGVEPNPFLATVGLRVEPGPVGSGVRFGLEVELGAMPTAFFTAVEESVHRTLRHGLHGWKVTDCAVTMTHSGYSPRQSHAHAVFDKSMSSTGRDFRHLTPLVLMAALRRAGTVVHEPMHGFHLEVPVGAVEAVLPALVRLGAVVDGQTGERSAALLAGEIPAARVHELRMRLPSLTRGEGLLECDFARYRPVRGAVPEHARPVPDPLDRAEYLLRVDRRVPRSP
ncbi:TetM/TetW/TetO/TetS family tetracycline resistance ribosomal protection protein [Pseudonocardia aurantiaca]|uniref:GTP-binding protein n=1 Tax=Pseudonocardia aurantiaca TaxID=75290 RepID=A0ABW4FKP4_9PSEU